MRIHGILAADREAIIEEALRAYGKPARRNKVTVTVLSMSPGVCGDNDGKYFGDVEIIEEPYDPSEWGYWLWRSADILGLK